MDTSKLTSVAIYGVLALVLFCAGYIFFLGARNIWRGIVSPHWPKVTGIVVISTTGNETTTDSDTHRTDTEYSATLSFRYNVRGQAYTTPLLYFGQTQGSGDPTEAQLRHLRYPQGAEISISYNPSDPSIAAAEPGFHAESLLLLIAGLMFGLPCIMGGIVYASMSSGVDDLGGGDKGMAIVACLFASIFAMAGIGALSLGLINLYRAHASETWPKVPGIITYQTLDSSDAGQGSTAYSNHLIFTYEVDGKKRFSNTRRFGLMAGGSEQSAEKAQADYPQGKAVTVSYLPDNPNLAVLEPGIDSEAYILPGIGIVILLFVTAICVFMIPALLRPF